MFILFSMGDNSLVITLRENCFCFINLSYTNYRVIFKCTLTHLSLLITFDPTACFSNSVLLFRIAKYKSSKYSEQTKLVFDTLSSNTPFSYKKLFHLLFLNVSLKRKSKIKDNVSIIIYLLIKLKIIT